MDALVTGAGGQLAAEWLLAAPRGCDVHALSRGDLDITDAAATRKAVLELRPALILNGAAYTAVDRAEGEPEAAFRVNRDGAANLAAAAAAAGARLVHISTDFVFDGEAGKAYRPDAATAPLGVYGASKLAGERAVLEALPGALIVRTAWVYSAHGTNFLKTMLRLMSSRDEVRVVADQIGAPTSAASLARATWSLATKGAEGVFHFTDAGVATWYDFAQAIAEEALAAGLLTRACRVTPISTRDYPTAARRPGFSVLDCTNTGDRLGAPAAHWRERLRQVIATLAAGGEA